MDIDKSAEQHLEQWLVHCSNAEQRAISLDDTDFYRYVWGRWLVYLPTARKGSNEQAISWIDAKPEDVTGFLEEGIQRKKEQVSLITKRRYWRLLERVYDHAIDRGLVIVNPARSVADAEIPAQENPLGAILNSKQWDAALTLLDVPVDSAEVRATEIRNRALLRVLFELGLTPAEIRSIDLHSFIDDGEGQGGLIKIRTGNANALRQLEISETTAQAVREWIAVRRSAGKHASTNALFSANTGKPMTDETLLSLVRLHLTRACAVAGLEQPIRLGPQIIRNSLLVKWMLDGVPQSEVALRAGLKNARCLNHLRIHLPDGPRLKLAAAAARKDNAPLLRSAA